MEAGDYNPVCQEGAPFVLSNAIPDGPGGQWSYLGTVLDSTIDPNANDPGEYVWRYTYTVPGSDCFASDSTIIEILPTPMPEMHIDWPSATLQAICTTDTLLLEGNKQDSQSAYTNMAWSGDGVFQAENDEYRLHIATTSAKKIALNYSVENEAGCSASLWDSLWVFPALSPEIDITANNNRIYFKDLSPNTHSAEWVLPDTVLYNKTTYYDFAKRDSFAITYKADDSLSLCATNTQMMMVGNWPLHRHIPTINISIYPNPVHQALSFEHISLRGNERIVVYNQLGQSVNLAQNQLQNGQLQVAGLSSGVYQVVVVQENQILQGAFVKTE